MIQFTEITVLFAVTFLIVTCYGHSVNEERKRSSDHIPRVTVQMTCSQDSSDVLCNFCFTNNGGEDVYFMKRNTPLEGLRSNFLTIKHDEQNHVKYEGCCFKRVPITKDDYMFLQAGHTVSTSTPIAVNHAYNFSHDGSYIIQYTGPLVYLTKDRMDTLLQENEQLTELGCSQSRDTLASTQINLEDVSNFHKYLKISIVVGGAVVGGVGAVAAVPLVVGALGFGAGGIAAGSVGASMMSWSAPTAATGVVATLQSIGAVGGMGAAATTVVAGTGAGVGAGVGAGAAVVGQVIVDAVVSNQPCDQDKSTSDLNMKIIDIDCEEISVNDFYREMSSCNETSDNI